MAYTNMTEEVGYCWSQGKKMDFPINTGTKIYEGSVVFLNYSGKGVYTASSGFVYVGVCCETADNTDSSGKRVLVRCEGVFEFTGSSLSDSYVGKTVYLDTSADPNSIVTTKPSTSGALIVPLGKIVKVLSETKCMVRIDGFAMKEDVTAAV